MVEKLIFKNLAGTIIQEEKFDYKYPEDWECLMDPGGEYSFVQPPKGYAVNTISYNPRFKTITYRCRRLHND